MTVTFRKHGPYRWQAQVRKKGYPLETETLETKAAAEAWARATEYEMDLGVFVSRAGAESTTLGVLLQRYLAGITPAKKGAGPESARIRLLLRHPLADRYVAGICGVDIGRYHDERLKKVSSATVKRDLVIVSHLFEVARKELGMQVHNSVRDIGARLDNFLQEFAHVPSRRVDYDGVPLHIAHGNKSSLAPLIFAYAYMRRRPLGSGIGSPNSRAVSIQS